MCVCVLVPVFSVEIFFASVSSLGIPLIAWLMYNDRHSRILATGLVDVPTLSSSPSPTKQARTEQHIDASGLFSPVVGARDEVGYTPVASNDYHT